jgi:hypothetical protein
VIVEDFDKASGLLMNLAKCIVHPSGALWNKTYSHRIFFDAKWRLSLESTLAYRWGQKAHCSPA